MTKQQHELSEEDLQKRRDALLREFEKESDRGVVLVSAAVMDDMLELLIREYFSAHGSKPKNVIDPLFSTFGPLASFSSKIRLAFALNMLDDWLYGDLRILKKLRNEFAHSFESADFGAQKVVSLTEKLRGADHAVKHLPEPQTSHPVDPAEVSCGRPPKGVSKALMERLRFTMSASYIGGLMAGRLEFLQQDVPKEVRIKIVTTPLGRLTSA